MGRSDAQEERLAALMRAARAGDRPAYTELLREIAALAKGAVRQRFRFLQPQDVEDLVQDILLSVHAARATWDPARPFLPWLTAIARNRMADGARRYARRSAREVADQAGTETFAADDANTLSGGYGDAEALARALAKLPRGQRRAVELTKLKEMSLKEAAAATGTSVGALKVAVHRGLSALRKALSGKS
jgi:RNA polymerase sigma-70 factor (ECF subfamily)